MTRAARLFVSLISLTLSPLAWAESRMAQLLAAGGIEENDAVRYELRNELSRPVREVKAGDFDYPSLGGEPAGRLKIIFAKAAVFYLFINRTAGGYPEAGKGNYLMKRNRSTGRFEYVKIFYRDEGFCYLEVRPHAKASRLDVLLFDRTLYHDLPLPMSLEQVLTAPLSSLFEMTRGVVEWEALLCRGAREEDARVLSLIRAIQAELPRVREAADGALDESGRFVTIADGRPQRGAGGLNCSGFAKWLVDGFYSPLAGRLTDIGTLKTKHPAFRGNRWTELREKEKDPYFGLDWTRNLAVALAGERTGGRPGVESCDVRRVPFFAYAEDSGYRVADLRHILYFLAIESPGTVYLGAVNDIYEPRPVLVEYYHVAVFLPYFDARGGFHVAVMDQHKDLVLEHFMDKYRNAFVHLVAVGTDSEFSLFHIE